MSSTTQVTTFQDIYTEILNRMRQPTNVTAVTEQSKRYANIALHDMVFGFEYKMPWLERDAVLQVRAPYMTGTVAIAAGSTTLTGTSTLWTTADVYGLNNARTTGKISLGDSNIYTINAVSGAGTITLNQRYVADSDLAAGADYVYFEDEYALASDFLKPIDQRTFTTAVDIPLIGRNDFRKRYPRPNVGVGGAPSVATILDKPFLGSTTPVVYIQFYPYPAATALIPYSYVTKNLSVSAAGVEQVDMSATTDEPNLPLQYRHALVLHAIANWYRDKKDDARAQLAIGDYQDTVQRIVSDQRIGANTMAQIQPRVGMYKGHARTPYGGSGRGRSRFSTNNDFDYFRD